MITGHWYRFHWRLRFDCLFIPKSAIIILFMLLIVYFQPNRRTKMKKYEKPEAEVIEIKDDVIVTSNGGSTVPTHEGGTND